MNETRTSRPAAHRREVCIAVDAMGGDHAPEAIVRGAAMAVRELPVRVILTGDRERVEPLVAEAGRPDGLEIFHASEVIPMDAHPAKAVRRQTDSSIVVASRLVKEGAAHALVSAGSTGAAMAAPFFQWGCIPGIDRPAIASLLPTLKGVCILLDAGAMVDSRPEHLLQFAAMGSAYAERGLGIDRPKVGLLNNGEEAGKGCELVRDAYKLLSASEQIHFGGNAEGRDILSGKFDVIVCDGFVGNVVLKFAEGISALMSDLIREGVARSARTKLGGWLLRPALREIWTKLDYTEYGGALLLGVKGVCVISHGSSNEKAIKNGIRVAYESVASNVIQTILEKVSGGTIGNDGAI